MTSHSFKGILSTVSILIGTIIGAGFASGQEIVTFFIRFGQPGFYGLAATGVFWIFSLYTLFYVLRKDRIHSYSELADILFGHRIGLLYRILVAVFMFLSLAIMISGTAALLQEQWNIPRFYGSLMMALLIYITLGYKGNGLAIVNSVLVPLLVIGILFASLFIIQTQAIPSAMLCLEPVETLNLRNSAVLQVLLSSLLYVSYNLISVTVIFAGISICKPRHAAVITGCILTFLSFSLGVATFINYGTIIEIDIPVPALLQGFPTLQWGYAALLLAAMYTTAIGSAYGCLEFCKSHLLMVSGAALVSSLGFTVLIDKGYTFFGYIGLFQLLLLFHRAVYLKRTSGH